MIMILWHNYYLQWCTLFYLFIVIIIYFFFFFKDFWVREGSWRVPITAVSDRGPHEISSGVDEGDWGQEESSRGTVRHAERRVCQDEGCRYVFDLSYVLFIFILCYVLLIYQDENWRYLSILDTLFLSNTFKVI